MGMYTELYISASLKSDAPDKVKEIIRLLFDGDNEHETDETDLPDHEFFDLHRWRMIGRCSSYYFSPFALSKIHEDDINGKIYFTSRSDLKNYGGEIGHFLNWIMPYLAESKGEHIGHYRYEEDEQPTLIYKR